MISRGKTPSESKNKPHIPPQSTIVQKPSLYQVKIPQPLTKTNLREKSSMTRSPCVRKPPYVTHTAYAHTQNAIGKYIRNILTTQKPMHYQRYTLYVQPNVRILTNSARIMTENRLVYRTPGQGPNLSRTKISSTS